MSYPIYTSGKKETGFLFFLVQHHLCSSCYVTILFNQEKVKRKFVRTGNTCYCCWQTITPFLVRVSYFHLVGRNIRLKFPLKCHFSVSQSRPYLRPNAFVDFIGNDNGPEFVSLFFSHFSWVTYRLYRCHQFVIGVANCFSVIKADLCQEFWREDQRNIQELIVYFLRCWYFMMKNHFRAWGIFLKYETSLCLVTWKSSNRLLRNLEYHPLFALAKRLKKLCISLENLHFTANNLGTFCVAFVMLKAFSVV